jgi:hypothetical protein
MPRTARPLSISPGSSLRNNTRKNAPFDRRGSNRMSSLWTGPHETRWWAAYAFDMCLARFTDHAEDIRYLMRITVFSLYSFATSKPLRRMMGLICSYWSIHPHQSCAECPWHLIKSYPCLFLALQSTHLNRIRVHQVTSRTSYNPHRKIALCLSWHFTTLRSGFVHQV